MKHVLTLALALLWIVIFHSVTSANLPLSTPTLLLPNVFDGYSVVLNAPDNGGACGITYGQNITVTREDGSVPANGELTYCNGTPINRTGGQLIVERDQNTGFWCFRGALAVYKITYNGQSTPFLWFPNSRSTGFYNVKDFGALGDGMADDTHAIKNALAFVAAKHGGTLYFPHGDYLVGGAESDFKGFTLPSGIVIEGASSLPSAPLANYFGQPQNASRIRVTNNVRGRTAARIFRIGECTQRVVIRNIELKSDIPGNTATTYGIEALGKTFDPGNPNAIPPIPPTGLSSHDLLIDNVSISDFKIGFYAHDVSAANHSWHFDYIEVRHCRFNGNTQAGISVSTSNTDWKIDHTVFDMPGINLASGIKGDGIVITHGGMFTIINTFAGNSSPGTGGTFIHADYPGNLTLINSQCEDVSKSLVYGDVVPPNSSNSGDLTYPLTLVNNILGMPIELKAPCTFVSTGNVYGPDTVNTVAGVRIYSTGDRFCYDWRTLGCRHPATQAQIYETGGFKGSGLVVFRTGQPRDRDPVPGQSPPEEDYIKDIPTMFGFDVEIRATDETATKTEKTALLSIFSPPSFALPPYTTQKPMLRLGAPNAYYDISRGTNGMLNFQAGPNTPPQTLNYFRGFSFDRPVKLQTYTRAQLADPIMLEYINTLGIGAMVFCTDCAHGTTPCAAGDGTIAVLNYVQGAPRWQCQ